MLMINLFFTFDEVISTGNTFQGQTSPNIGNLLKSN